MRLFDLVMHVGLEECSTNRPLVLKKKLLCHTSNMLMTRKKEKQPFSVWKSPPFTFVPGNLEFSFNISIDITFLQGCPHL